MQKDSVQRWNQEKSEYEPSPVHVEAFLNELEALYLKHGLALSHEDSHGAFIIQPYEPSLVEWVRDAHYLPLAVNVNSSTPSDIKLEVKHPGCDRWVDVPCLEKREGVRVPFDQFTFKFDENGKIEKT